MTIDFYYVPGSPPCRAVLLTAKALGIDLNLKLVNLHDGEHLKPEYLKMNPQHTVPTIDDDGFYLSESRAILTYFVEKYGKDDSLYPKDPQKRALVNQRLYFDIGTFFSRFADAHYTLAFAGIPISEDKAKKIDESFEWLNQILSESEFVAGEKYTVADFSLVAGVTSYQATGYDISKYPNVDKWVKKLKTVLPGYEETNGAGNEAFRQFYTSLVKK